MESNQQAERVYFIRHNLKNHNKVEMLKRRKRIAIQFNRESFHKWNDYSFKSRKNKAFQRAWDYFQDIRKNGAIIVAQYTTGHYLIGRVKKGARLRFISPRDKKGLLSLKTLKLQRTRNVSHKQFPIMSIIKPMFSTISPIRKNIQYVMYAYGLAPLTPSLANMHYKLQETMCSEWLRSNHCPKAFQLQYLLANPGSGMEAVDILGRTKTNKKLFAQVTYSGGKRVLKKVSKLLAFSKGAGINIMFSNADLPPSVRNVRLIPLDQVWKDLYRDRKYKGMLLEMIGIKTKQLRRTAA